MSPTPTGWLWWKKRRSPWLRSWSACRSVEVVPYPEERTVGWERLWGRWRSSLSRRGPKVNAQRARGARSSDSCWSRCTSSASQSSQLKDTHAVSFVTQLVLTFSPLSWLVGGAESIRMCSTRSCQESHQWTGAATERVRQSKRVLYLYFLSLSFIHLQCRVNIWNLNLIHLLSAHTLFVCPQQSDPGVSSHQLSSWRGNLSLALPREAVRVWDAQGSLRIQRKDGGQRAKVRGKRKKSRLFWTTCPHTQAVTFSHWYWLCSWCCSNLAYYF